MKNGVTPENVCVFFSSGRNIKRFMKACDYLLLQTLNEALTAALTERKIAHDEAEKQRTEREQKRNELLAFIKGEGFSPEELILKKPDNTRAKRTMKYQYVEDGKSKQWSGVGKTPRPIQEALNSGKTLESFLISKGG